MNPIYYIDRETGEKKIEKVYQNNALELLYGNSKLNRWLNQWLLPLLTKWPLFSWCYGSLQKLPGSKRKIKPFIHTFEVDETEFLDPVSSYRSFNDFFIRRLKSEARPIANKADCAVIPADGRYYFYSNMDTCDGFIVKGKKFSLEELLNSSSLADEYKGGSLVLARLCPSDYHRFHFPCDCTAGPTILINGWLFSVNPLAIKQNIQIFSQNKRALCELHTELFGKVLFMEIGATCVGSIQETYIAEKKQIKGAEKGYFEFGGSALILLFKQGTIEFDQDLVEATEKGLEIRCLMGQQMGCATIK